MIRFFQNIFHRHKWTHWGKPFAAVFTAYQRKGKSVYADKRNYRGGALRQGKSERKIRNTAGINT